MTAAVEDRPWAADISWLLIAPLPGPPTDRRLLPLTGVSPRRTAPTIVCELIWCPGGWPWVFADADAWSETECWQVAMHYGWVKDWIGRRACPACRQHPEFRPAPATCLPAPYIAPPGKHKRQPPVPVTVATPVLPPLPEVIDDTDVITAAAFDWDTPPADTPLPHRRWSLPWSRP